MPFRYSRGEVENQHAIFGFRKRACGLRVESPETVIQESWEDTKCSAPGRDGDASWRAHWQCRWILWTLRHE